MQLVNGKRKSNLQKKLWEIGLRHPRILRLDPDLLSRTEPGTGHRLTRGAKNSLQILEAEGLPLQGHRHHPRGPPVVVGHVLVTRQGLHGPPQLVGGHQTLLCQYHQGGMNLVGSKDLQIVCEITYLHLPELVSIFSGVNGYKLFL